MICACPRNKIQISFEIGTFSLLLKRPVMPPIKVKHCSQKIDRAFPCLLPDDTRMTSYHKAENH